MNQSITTAKESILTGFRPVGLDAIPLLKVFFQKYPSRSCDFTIGGTLMWSEYFHYRYTVVADTLFLVGKVPESNTLIFYKPCGPLPPDTCREMIAGYVHDHHRDGALLLPFESEAGTEAENSIETPCVDDWKEYLYEAEKFRKFAGKKMEKKRNHLNFFMNHYPQFEVETIGKENLDEVISFTMDQAANHTDYLFRYENAATIKTLRNYELYPFDGILIRIDGKVAGYTFGEVTGDTLHVHVEKGNTDYRGIYQALASIFCNRMCDLRPEVRYLNREEDMGNEELRYSKLSYHPALYVNKRLHPIH